jgi:hypothetical protein
VYAVFDIYKYYNIFIMEKGNYYWNILKFQNGITKREKKYGFTNVDSAVNWANKNLTELDDAMLQQIISKSNHKFIARMSVGKIKFIDEFSGGGGIKGEYQIEVSNEAQVNKILALADMQGVGASSTYHSETETHTVTLDKKLKYTSDTPEWMKTTPEMFEYAKGGGVDELPLERYISSLPIKGVTRIPNFSRTGDDLIKMMTVIDEAPALLNIYKLAVERSVDGFLSRSFSVEEVSKILRSITDSNVFWSILKQKYRLELLTVPAEKTYRDWATKLIIMGIVGEFEIDNSSLNHYIENESLKKEISNYSVARGKAKFAGMVEGSKNYIYNREGRKVKVHIPEKEKEGEQRFDKGGEIKFSINQSGSAIFDNEITKILNKIEKEAGLTLELLAEFDKYDNWTKAKMIQSFAEKYQSDKKFADKIKKIEERKDLQKEINKFECETISNSDARFSKGGEFTGEEIAKRCETGMQIQTLLFPKINFTKNQAKNWAKEHEFKFGKVDETKKFYRLRQIDPSEFLKKPYGTKIWKNGIKAVFACPKKK